MIRAERGVRRNRFEGQCTMDVTSTYVMTGALLFAIGLIGFLARRNLIIMFLSTEIMFQGVIVNLIGFGLKHGDLTGQAFAIFLLVIAAVEAGLALGLVVLLFRRKGTLDADAWRTLRG
jgi:NADH-quinone oxidoreductase subunit K